MAVLEFAPHENYDFYIPILGTALYRGTQMLSIVPYTAVTYNAGRETGQQPAPIFPSPAKSPAAPASQQVSTCLRRIRPNSLCNLAIFTGGPKLKIRVKSDLNGKHPGLENGSEEAPPRPEIENPSVNMPLELIIHW